jgi:hypothetical protein
MATTPDHVKRQLREKSAWAQFQQDVDAIALFMRYPCKARNPKETSRVRPFLVKLFQTIRYGGLLFRENARHTHGRYGWQWWHYTGIPIASVFGHGGRVMIQCRTDRFHQWLFNEVQHQWSGRPSTHNIRGQPTSGYPERVNQTGLTKYIKEVKVKAHGSKGLDAACWGAERANPHSDTIVTRNGKHGHFCIVRDFTHEEDGNIKGILIGLEASGPTHKDQYGGSHGPDGASGEFSPTGSQKWRYLEIGPGCRHPDTNRTISGGLRTKKVRTVKKLWVGKKTKVVNPTAADTLLIVIPSNWRPRHFEEREQFESQFLAQTTRKPRGWQAGWNTPQLRQVESEYRELKEDYMQSALLDDEKHVHDVLDIDI